MGVCGDVAADRLGSGPRLGCDRRSRPSRSIVPHISISAHDAARRSGPQPPTQKKTGEDPEGALMDSGEGA